LDLNNTNNTMPGRVLITGLNGYIAAHTAAAFLKAGYTVRGTVRSTTNIESLVQALSKFHDGGRLEIEAVPDIACAGAFDRAVEGILRPNCPVWLRPSQVTDSL
jgi:nucleoside-diphosphate-sugar epimerase